MKCFICGSKCRTLYLFAPFQTGVKRKIQAIAKECNECDWVSSPTKVPTKI